MKALADLAGKPLIIRLHERLGTNYPIAWCTSYLEQDGPLCLLGSGVGNALVLAGDPVDIVSRFILAAQLFKADTVIRVTGDNPLTDPHVMNTLIAAHSGGYTFTDDPPKGTKSEIISLALLEKFHAEEDPKKSEDFSNLMRSGNYFPSKNVGFSEKYRRPEMRLTVDYPSDLELVQDIYNHYEGNPPTLPEIIEYVESKHHNHGAQLRPIS